MLASEIWRIVLLGSWGFSGKCIARNVKRYDGTNYDVSSVYRTLKKAGIRLRDYRDGESDTGHDQLDHLQAKTPKRIETEAAKQRAAEKAAKRSKKSKRRTVPSHTS